MTDNEHPDLPFAPAASRNAEPIESVLEGLLPQTGTVLEIASGTGQHVTRFAARFPTLTWQPTDVSNEQCSAIDERVRRADLGNVRSATTLNAGAPWPFENVDAVVIINLVHIVPWDVTVAMLENSGAALNTGGLLYLYGPYRREGRHTSEGNQQFDTSLRARDASSGIRDLEAVIRQAEASGFEHRQTIEMPANNLSLAFSKHI